MKWRDIIIMWLYTSEELGLRPQQQQGRFYSVNHQQTTTVVYESRFITLCRQCCVLSRDEAGAGVLSLLRPRAALYCYSAWAEPSGSFSKPAERCMKFVISRSSALQPQQYNRILLRASNYALQVKWQNYSVCQQVVPNLPIFQLDAI